MGKNNNQSNISEIKALVHQVGKDIGTLGKKAKEAYDDLDPQTKKKVVGAIAGLGALLIGAKTAKHAKKRHDKKKATK